ncbi:MAG: hypothetical protein LBD37_03505 [Treponema sp.]|nr:hypothetical protein [Treponema sp.]
MELAYEFAKIADVDFVLAGPFLWAAVLSAGYSGLKFDNGASVFLDDSPPGAPERVAFVSVDGQIYEQAESAAEVKSAPRTFYQAGRLVYVRFMHNDEEAPDASAQSYLFAFKSVSIGTIVTNGEFYYDEEGRGVRHAVISNYQMKLQGDSGSYDKIKFSSVTVTALKAFVPPGLSQTVFKIYWKKVNRALDFMFVSKTVEGIDTLSITGKDIRALFSSAVLKQKYEDNAGDYLGDNGIQIMDKDTLKLYKKDAVGCCRGVVADCINGYAFDTRSYRSYRAGYGKITPDPYNKNAMSFGVEVEQENSWLGLPPVSPGAAGGYWITTTIERQYDGSVIETTLFNVKDAIAHPPQEGLTVPNVDSTPRKLRITGVFHAEIPGVTNILTQVEYFLKKYSTLPYADRYFNKAEIASELSKMSGKASGIAVTEPAGLYDVIALLQNGNTYGWKFANYDGKLTARLDDPARAAETIPAADIVNIEELRIEANGEEFVTDLRILYNKNYSESSADKAFSAYADRERELRVRSRYLAAQEKSFQTLLKDAAAAKERFNRYERRYSGSRAVITGVKLRRFNYAFILREYSPVTMDLRPLTDMTNWTVTALTADITNETVQIDIAEE